ncbi:AraD1 family protein [Terriglobus sp.]|uniref:AraD1 family protein n=1 Tax=Terriglobus sp. TaxID=1889013 RepID=UPI003B003698
MRLVQITNGSERRVAVVDEPELVLLQQDVTSTYALALRALETQQSLSELVLSLQSGDRLPYDEVYGGASPWRLLAPIDVPGDPQKVLVSGTGLTHLGSARERQAMHAAAGTVVEEVDESRMTDSMRMFAWGQQRGRPAAGEIGIAPEWFYKGDGSVVKAPGEALTVPGHAEDGGEEAEIATVYVIAANGVPHRIGMTTGNEFSDHVFERRNYLNLAGSKLRECSIGPELVLDPDFQDVPGFARVLRGSEILWEKQIRTGETNMAHSLANMEHHHFKFAGHRQAGMVHIHFLGADALSFGSGVRLTSGDIAEVQFEGFGRALRNPIVADEPLKAPVRVQVMR